MLLSKKVSHVFCIFSLILAAVVTYFAYLQKHVGTSTTTIEQFLIPIVSMVAILLAAFGSFNAFGQLSLIRSAEDSRRETYNTVLLRPGYGTTNSRAEVITSLSN